MTGQARQYQLPVLAINFRWRRGACAAVPIFIIWFVICLGGCYGNHCIGSRPPLRILQRPFRHFNNCRTNVHKSPSVSRHHSARSPIWTNPSLLCFPNPPLHWNILLTASEMIAHPCFWQCVPDYSCFQGGEPAAPQLIRDYSIWAIPNPRV